MALGNKKKSATYLCIKLLRSIEYYNTILKCKFENIGYIHQLKQEIKSFRNNINTLRNRIQENERNNSINTKDTNKMLLNNIQDAENEINEMKNLILTCINKNIELENNLIIFLKYYDFIYEEYDNPLLKSSENKDENNVAAPFMAP